MTRLTAFIESPGFRRFIIGVIIFNAAILGLETSKTIMARAGGVIYLLEVNTLPGMTPTSLYPDGAGGFGLDFPRLVRHLVERALNRS